MSEPSTLDIIDQIIAGNYNQANDLFNQEMGSRIDAALDSKRAEVGSSISFDSEDDVPEEDNDFEQEEDIQSELEDIDPVDLDDEDD